MRKARENNEDFMMDLIDPLEFVRRQEESMKNLEKHQALEDKKKKEGREEEVKANKREEKLAAKMERKKE